MNGTNKELALETMIFNTVVRAFNEEGIPITMASIIMRSVAGRIDNMAIQSLTEENYQLQMELAKTKQTDKKEEEGASDERESK